MEANKQAKLPAVVSATPAVVQMERARGVLQQHMRTASSIAKLRSTLRLYGIGGDRIYDCTRLARSQ